MRALYKAGGSGHYQHCLEVGRRREREAHFQAHIRGMGLSRVGQVFVA